MLRDDVTAGLFRHRSEVDIPDREREALAYELKDRGFLKIRRRYYVRCVNPVDPDQASVKDRCCDGVIYLSPAFHEDHVYRCPQCFREVFPWNKKRGRVLWLSVIEDALGAFVVSQIEAAGLEVRERPRGVYVVTSERAMVVVCFVDLCLDSDVFGLERFGKIVFVVANDVDYLRRVPKGAEVFRFVDMVLGDAAARFQRLLRGLVKEEVGRGPRDPYDGAGLPAIASLRPPLAEPMASYSSSPAREALAPRGTRWNEIELYLVDGETLSVRVAGDRPQRKKYYDLGMADGRGGAPTKRWELLVRLCEASGRLEWRGSQKGWSTIKKLVSQLRESLQQAFGINEDPLELHRKTGLVAAFSAYSHAPGERPRSEREDHHDLY